MKEHYVFKTKKLAVAAEKYICNVAGFPWIGNNAKTGKPAPDKQQTTRWAIVRQRATDGKWHFQRLPSSDLDSIPKDIIDKFNTDYSHTIEEKQADWTPDE